LDPVIPATITTLKGVCTEELPEAIAWLEITMVITAVLIIAALAALRKLRIPLPVPLIWFQLIVWDGRADSDFSADSPLTLTTSATGLPFR
jgi:hypothetical protein